MLCKFRSAASAGARQLARCRPTFLVARSFSEATTETAIKAPPMVYISGEEMTRYTMELVLDRWVKPYVDISNWEFYALDCKTRDDTNDQVLRDAVDAGKRVCAIFKEPTITPTAEQGQSMGLKNVLSSPNGLMRKGWNGITISRDTIHIDGLEFGFENPVLFERHAVGGEYGAGWATVGQGRLITTFFPDDEDTIPTIVDHRILTDKENVAVVYHNPLDNVTDLAHRFFQRCLDHRVTPYVVTKKTVFKWQEAFWQKMLDVFEKGYRSQFQALGLVKDKLGHLISDAATMQIVRWRKGGFGMAAHNYDGDMLTDQIHRSPGFITSNLIGKRDDGVLIQEFEASHGTVSDLWHDHLAGKETSMNPLGLVEALIGAMDHSARISQDTAQDRERLLLFTADLRAAVHETFASGEGTRDMMGPEGKTTEEFMDAVAARLEKFRQKTRVKVAKTKIPLKAVGAEQIDDQFVEDLYSQLRSPETGKLGLDEFRSALVKLGIAPKKNAETAEGKVNPLS